MNNKSHRKVVIIGSISAVVMFFFCFAIVPFYSVICSATGISTSIPTTLLQQARDAKDGVQKNRDVIVQFVATNHMGMPWDFFPRVQSVVVHPGQNTKVFFHAKNTTANTMNVQAVPSMTPTDAMAHFHKIECFCFKQQTLNGEESREMPLIFYVDKDLPKEIRVITLSYTLFDVTPKATRKG